MKHLMVRKLNPIRIPNRQDCNSILHKFSCFSQLWNSMKILFFPCHYCWCIRSPLVLRLLGLAKVNDSRGRASLVNVWRLHPSLDPITFDTKANKFFPFVLFYFPYLRLDYSFDSNQIFKGEKKYIQDFRQKWSLSPKIQNIKC